MIGIQSGMVMQRGQDDTCSIYLEHEQPMSVVTYENTDRQPAEAMLASCGSGRWHLHGIPAGGPYTVKVDGRIYTDIYVGDVWILAGQSNMKGNGRLTADDEQFEGDPMVRAFYMTDQWGTANHPLHDPGVSVDPVYIALGAESGNRPRFNSVGPGLAFARKMKAMTGVPQGVLCGAHGGASLAQWSPALKDEGGDSLYGAAFRRFIVNGAHVRGMFWYQGCSEIGGPSCEAFTANMKGFIAACRRDFGNGLPVVQVQIGRRINDENERLVWRGWNGVREQQRRLYEEIDGLHTISAVSAAIDDLLHVGGADLARLGKEAAEVMYRMIYQSDGPAPLDGSRCLLPPQCAGHAICTDPLTGGGIVEVRYTNLHGNRLEAGSRPAGFRLLAEDKYDSPQLIFDVRLKGDTACLRIDPRLRPGDLQGMVLYYGHGTDPYCNITDAAGRSIPAMGPVIL